MGNIITRGGQQGTEGIPWSRGFGKGPGRTTRENLENLPPSCFAYCQSCYVISYKDPNHLCFQNWTSSWVSLLPPPQAEGKEGQWKKESPPHNSHLHLKCSPLLKANIFLGVRWCIRVFSVCLCCCCYNCLFIFYLKELAPTEGIGWVETFRLQVVLRSTETTLSSGTDRLEENIL